MREKWENSLEKLQNLKKYHRKKLEIEFKIEMNSRSKELWWWKSNDDLGSIWRECLYQKIWSQIIQRAELRRQDLAHFFTGLGRREEAWSWEQQLPVGIETQKESSKSACCFLNLFQGN